jgi:DNA-binding CsgD family transcriptional regulator
MKTDRVFSGRFKDVLDNVVSANSAKALTVAFQNLASTLGYTRWTISYIVPARTGEPYDSFTTIDNHPEELNQIALRDRWGTVDPSVQRVKHCSRPFLWNRQAYLDVGRNEHWECLASFGYQQGTIGACHLPAGDHLLCGFGRDEAVTLQGADELRALAEFQLAVSCSIDSAIRLLAKSPSVKSECPLTHRERECLQWTAIGKTAWEIGRILSISERTAHQHLQHAARKLNATNKIQAAIKAERNGWT